MVYVNSYNTQEIPTGNIIINTTSRSNTWSRDLSPFFLPVSEMYQGYTAKNVENAWQFSKVYKEHLNTQGEITAEYFKWAQAGWKSNYAIRYPKGKNRKPEFSYWDGERYDYVTARKKIYAPLYAKAVQKSPAWNQLVKTYQQATQQGIDVYLIDFDGYNHLKEGFTFQEVINNPRRKMGHAFILWYLLTK